MYFFLSLRKNRKKYIEVLCELFLLLFLAAFLVLLLLFMLKETQLEINIIIKNGKNSSFVIIRLLKFLRIRLNLSIRHENGAISLTIKKTDSDLEKETSIEQALESMIKIFRRLRTYKQAFDYLKTRIIVNNFSVRTIVGTGNAAATALASGGFYTVFHLITLHLQNYYQLSKQKLKVIPYFNGPLFDLDLDCIINFKIGHIIITGIKMISKSKGGVTNV